MRNCEEWNNKGLTRKQGWCRAAEKLVNGTLPYGKRWPNGELNPTPRRVVAREAQTSGVVHFSMCDETTHFSLCQGDGSSSDQGEAGSSKRKKWNQLGHGRYKVIARRDRGNPGAPWGHPNHRWARKEDGPTLDAVEAAVINRELNKDFKLNRSEGKRARLATRITERRPTGRPGSSRDNPRDGDGRELGAGFEEADREVGQVHQDDETSTEVGQIPAEGKGNVHQREEKRRRLETMDDIEVRDLNAR